MATLLINPETEINPIENLHADDCSDVSEGGFLHDNPDYYFVIAYGLRQLGIRADSPSGSASTGSSFGNCTSTTNVGSCDSPAGSRYSHRADTATQHHRPADAYHDQSSRADPNHDASTVAGHGCSKWNDHSPGSDN